MMTTTKPRKRPRTPIEGSRKRVLAIRVKTKNDVNGNPRRGWLVFEPDGSHVGSFAEDYQGEYAFRERFPAGICLATVNVTPREYKRITHQHARYLA